MGGASAAVGVAREEAFEALLAEAVGVGGAGVALKERKPDRAVDVEEDLFSAGPERLQLGTELVGECDACVDEILASAHERLQRQCLIAGGREHGEAVTVGSGELAQHERVEAVVLARGRTETITRALTWLGWIASTTIPAARSLPTKSPSGRSIAQHSTAVSEQQL